jgi:hypothetical protein
VLVEGAWSYRFPARVTSPIQAAWTMPGSGAGDRLEGAAPALRPLPAARGRGKNANLVATAVAREMAAFAWAIACQVQPQGAAA